MNIHSRFAIYVILVTTALTGDLVFPNSRFGLGLLLLAVFALQPSQRAPNELYRPISNRALVWLVVAILGWWRAQKGAARV